MTAVLTAGFMTCHGLMCGLIGDYPDTAISSGTNTAIEYAARIFSVIDNR